MREPLRASPVAHSLPARGARLGVPGVAVAAFRGALGTASVAVCLIGAGLVSAVLGCAEGRAGEATPAGSGSPASRVAPESSVSPSITAPSAPTPTALPPLPARLSETGLYVAGSTSEVDPRHVTFVPQYPLWSDGTDKRRWLFLPPGTRIDASDPDAWVFPVGTRLWKEFSSGGGRIETRYIERALDGSYRYATYVWDEALGDAVLAPARGVRAARALAGGVKHDVPALLDCQACHEGGKGPVLGFGALQLSSDRDPLAPHAEPVPPGALDLDELVRRDLIEDLPARLLERAPRIGASSPSARAAAGYLFGNCASCHNARGPLAALALDFDQSVLVENGAERLAQHALEQPSRFRVPGEDSSRRAVAAEPTKSAIWFRMQTRSAVAQMPPLGTQLADAAGVALIERWISHDLRPSR